MKVKSESVRTITIELTEAEALRVGGFLYSVPTASGEFLPLADALNAALPEVLPDYEVNEDGEYDIITDEETR